MTPTSTLINVKDVNLTMYTNLIKLSETFWEILMLDKNFVSLHVSFNIDFETQIFIIIFIVLS